VVGISNCLSPPCSNVRTPTTVTIILNVFPLTIVVVSTDAPLISREAVGDALTVRCGRCDVAAPGQLAEGFEGHLEAFGGVDVVVNNAGVAERGDFTELDEVR